MFPRDGDVGGSRYVIDQAVRVEGWSEARGGVFGLGHARQLAGG
jgi:hypothetical protein